MTNNDVHRDRDLVSDEVASEGGTPGDVELDRDDLPAHGSEAGTLWEPRERGAVKEIHRDETGRGRRSPAG